MNFLERRAFKRARKRLGHLMEPGEELLNFDIFVLEPPHPQRARVDIVVSDLALYMKTSLQPKDNWRWTYPEILSIAAPSQFFPTATLRFVGDQAFVMTARGAPRGALEIARKRVEGMTITTEDIILPSLEKPTTFTLRFVGAPAEPVWFYQFPFRVFSDGSVASQEGMVPIEVDVEAAHAEARSEIEKLTSRHAELMNQRL